MTRRERVQAIIDSRDIDQLRQMSEGYPCACQGPVDGEKHRVCIENRNQVRAVFSYLALRQGRLAPLKHKGPQ